MCAAKALPSISAHYVLYGRWPHLWAENHIDSVRVYLRASGGNFIEEIKRRQDAGPALEQRNGHSGTEQDTVDTVGQSRSWRENCWHCPLQCFPSEAQLCSLLLTTIAAHDFSWNLPSTAECNVTKWLVVDARPWERKAAAFLESLHIPPIVLSRPTEDLPRDHPINQLVVSADVPNKT